MGEGIWRYIGWLRALFLLLILPGLVILMGGMLGLVTYLFGVPRSGPITERYTHSTTSADGDRGVVTSYFVRYTYGGGDDSRSARAPGGIAKSGVNAQVWETVQPGDPVRLKLSPLLPGWLPPVLLIGPGGAPAQSVVLPCIFGFIWCGVLVGLRWWLRPRAWGMTRGEA